MVKADSRIRCERHEGMIRVVVRPVRDTHAWVAGLIITIATTVGVVTGVPAVESATHGNGRNLAGMIVVALGFVGMTVLLSRDVLWGLFGHEEVAANASETTITTRLLVFRIRRSLQTLAITNVDWAERPMKWARGSRRRLFVQLGSRRVELRSDLSLPEANYLAKEIWPLIQELQRAVKDGSYRGGGRTPAP